jgi:CubicO group peptidase (beta-lactamase class C family)
MGMKRGSLVAMARLVGGRGCVVKEGTMVYAWGDVSKSSDVASAMKPVISTLMLMAVEEGKIGGVDERVSRFEPRLVGKNEGITWRQLASQMSGYGLVERPGEAYSYNDFALALYYDTLMGKVYGEKGSEVLKKKLGEVLGFEDRYTFEVFGEKDRPGRLGISVRDYARFGLMYMRGGRWKDKQILKEELVRMGVSSPIGADTKLTSGEEAEMIAGQRSIGGTRNITSEGPGWYSFNWWVNGKNKEGKRLYENLPADAYVASGHGGRRMMVVAPSWSIIVVWNEAEKMEEKRERQEEAMKLLREAIR